MWTATATSTCTSPTTRRGPRWTFIRRRSAPSIRWSGRSARIASRSSPSSGKTIGWWTVPNTTSCRCSNAPTRTPSISTTAPGASPSSRGPRAASAMRPASRWSPRRSTSGYRPSSPTSTAMARPICTCATTSRIRTCSGSTTARGRFVPCRASRSGTRAIPRWRSISRTWIETATWISWWSICWVAGHAARPKSPPTRRCPSWSDRSTTALSGSGTRCCGTGGTGRSRRSPATQGSRHPTGRGTPCSSTSTWTGTKTSWRPRATCGT